jgi:hypothetical protein
MGAMTNVNLVPIERECQALVQCIDDHPLIGAVVRGDASRDEYIRFLVATYHYVRWSGPLLAATAAGLRRRGHHPWLAALAETKAEEESPHDRWALDDLRCCGENVELVKLAPAPLAVRAYVDWSLAMADDGSPAFLGAAYALEFMSMSRARLAANNLQARGEIPGIDRAVSFLAGHGDADVGHVALLADVLARLDDPQDAEEIRLSAAMLRRLYPRFFRTSDTVVARGAAGAA